MEPGFFCLVRSRRVWIKVATLSVSGHPSLSHRFHSDPFPALWSCQTEWLSKGFVPGNSRNKLSFTADKPQACVYNVCVHMLGRHLYACKVCVGTMLQPCAYSWVLDSYPMSQSIKCFLVYYLLYFISLRSHAICSPQPTCLLITLVFSVFCCFVVTSGNQENKKKKGASITG